ncbi:MAG: hypothetical protein ACLR6J_06710 [Parabacteroides merdae]
MEEKDSGVVFQYLKEGVERARQYGFRGYPGLALEQTVHEKNVLDLFSKRIINFERTDTKWLLEFWEVDQSLKEDTLYMLAMTQGKMQTDSFEFLASFHPGQWIVVRHGYCSNHTLRVRPGYPAQRRFPHL